MTQPVAFAKTSTEPVRFDKKLGRCVGWACFSKKDGADYVDLHGDHFPDAELFEAVDALNKQPLEKRAINVEHAGPSRGVIVSAFALTEDIAKGITPPIDTGGTYGVLVSFEPDAELLKSIENGGSFCLSIEGSAADVETIAKSAGDIAATAHKRTMRKVTLTKLAVVERGAHEGAAVSVIKAAPDAVELWKRAVVDKSLAGAKKQLRAAIALHQKHMDGTAPTSAASQQKLMDQIEAALEELGDDSMAKAAVTKRAPALTAADGTGHQHLISDADEADGFTSWEKAPGAEYGHSHPWVHDGPDGSISIGEAEGHRHTLETSMTDDIAKAQNDLTAARAEIAKRDTRIGALASLLALAASLPPDQAAFAKSLPPDQLEGFLAKPAAERATLATPVYKSATTGETFFAGDNRIELAKALDAQGVELAKSREAGKVAAFAKTAREKFPSLLGGEPAGIAIAKAAAGEVLDEAERKLLVDAASAASAAIAKLCTPTGYGGGGTGDDADPKVALEKAAQAFAKSKPALSPIEALREFNASDEGQRLYAAAYPTGN